MIEPLTAPCRVYTSEYLKCAFDFETLCQDAGECLSSVDYDTLVCTGTSGVVAASVLAMRLGKKLAVVRKTTERCHTGNRVEGELGARWVLVDDFVGTGETLVHVLQVMLQYDSSMAGVFLYATAAPTESDVLAVKAKFYTRELVAKLPCNIDKRHCVQAMLADHAAKRTQQATNGAAFWKFSPAQDTIGGVCPYQANDVPAGTSVWDIFASLKANGGGL